MTTRTTKYLDKRRRIEAFLSAWHAEFGVRHASVQAALFACKRNAALRLAIDEACAVRTGNALAGALRHAIASPFDGYRVHKTVQRDPNGDAQPAKWSVERTTPEPAKVPAPVPPPAAPPTIAPETKAALDDDRLMAVVTAAMGERCITGAQADRLLALWCEVRP